MAALLISQNGSENLSAGSALGKLLRDLTEPQIVVAVMTGDPEKIAAVVAADPDLMERAAIREHEGNMSRPDAEIAALFDFIDESEYVF
jgi:hypothetical protein